MSDQFGEDTRYPFQEQKLQRKAAFPLVLTIKNTHSFIASQLGEEASF